MLANYIYLLIEIARKAFVDKRRLFVSKMNLELKKRIMKCLVWRVAETWTLMKVDV